MSDTEIHYFDPADHAQDAANQLDELSGGAQLSITLQNHNADPVGNWIGSNPSTYGKISDDSSTTKEILNAVDIGSGDHEHTTHNCYGANADQRKCKNPYGNPQSLIIYSNRSKP